MSPPPRKTGRLDPAPEPLTALVPVVVSEVEEPGGVGPEAPPPKPLRQALPVSVHSEDICAGRGSPPHVRAGSTRHLLDCSVRCRTTDVKAPRPCGERAARRKAYSVLGLRSSTTNAVAGSKVLPTWGRGRERRRETRRETETETVEDR